MKNSARGELVEPCVLCTPAVKKNQNFAAGDTEINKDLSKNARTEEFYRIVPQDFALGVIGNRLSIEVG
jgi:hypothetical protein